MEKVASHINDMQKIYEDFGSVFEQLAAEQSGADKQVMITMVPEDHRPRLYSETTTTV